MSQSKKNLPAKRNNEQRRIAATLDAEGVRRNEIAEIVGVSPKSITEWRKEAEYQKLMAQASAVALEAVGNMIVRFKRRALDGADDALDVLVSALEAEDEEGHPLWIVRLDAAKTLVRMGAELGWGDRVKSDGAVAAAAAVIVVQANEHGDVTVQGVGEEDIHDGSWRSVGDGDDRAQEDRDSDRAAD